MKAVIVKGPGIAPVYGEFREPGTTAGMEVIAMRASALSPLSKARASGAHYSADGIFPAVPGVDGVGYTEDGRRVYLLLPQAPFGALAQRCLVDARHCIEVPPELDDVTAAAIANPGMSAWAAFVERAALRPGETVLVNGATGSAGRLAVQIAKYLGAARVIVTGRNAMELSEMAALGADDALPFALGVPHPTGAREFEQALGAALEPGVDVVLDYLWGESAKAIILAIAKTVAGARPVRFVQVGAGGGEETLALPSAALRSSGLQLMGSGAGSVPLAKLLEAVGNVFAATLPAKLQVSVKAMPLASIAEAWTAPGRPRIVITIP